MFFFRQLRGRRVSTSLFRLVLVLFAITAAETNGLAQNTSSGTIAGQVTDESGAAIPGAEIRLVDKATNSVKSFQSNEAGRYNIFNLDPGTYDVSVNKSWILGDADTGTRGAGRACLNVECPAPLRPNLNHGRSCCRCRCGVADHQCHGRLHDFGRPTRKSSESGSRRECLVSLQPGVAPNGNVAGTVSDQNQFQLDGGNNSSDMDGNQPFTLCPAAPSPVRPAERPPASIPTPIETIEEFKVGTANQTADFNGSAGGQVQMATKRGTSAFHGSAYDYLLSSYFSANTWKNNHTPSGNLGIHAAAQNTPEQVRCFSGRSHGPSFLGGKTFFFFNYEGAVSRRPRPLNGKFRRPC